MHDPFYHLESIFSLNSRYLDKWSIRDPLLCYSDDCIIYVLDTGLDASHTEFQFSDLRVLSSHDANSSHATSLISLINGKTLGVSPHTTVCFIDINADEMFFDVLKKHRKENKDKVGIILCAWQLPNLGNDLQNEMQDVFLDLLNGNDILITACGNKGQGKELEFPATIKHPCNIIVGSHDPWGFISKFNTKTETSRPRIFAPGRRVFTASKNDAYKESSGSSYAAAIVAGCVSYFCEKGAKNTKIVRQLNEHANQDKLCWKDLPEKMPNKSVFVGTRPDLHKLPLVVPLDDLGFMKRGSKGNEVYSEIPRRTDRDISEILDGIILPLKEKDIVVPLSGGVDSEWVTRVLYERDIDFTAKTVRYWFDEEEINKHDTDNINWDYIDKHQFVDLDVKWFFEQGVYFHYMQEYESPSPQLCTHLWLLDQTQEFFVFAGDMLYEKDGIWTRPSDQYFSYDLYKWKNKRKGISRLWCANGELVRKIEILARNAETNSFHKDKHSVLQQLGYDIKRREKEYTGFEGLKEKYRQQTGCYRYFDRRFRNILPT